MANRLPEKLTALRKNFNESLADAAGKAGVPVAEYMNWENGNTIPRIEQLRKIAAIYRVNLTELADNEREVTLPHPDLAFESVNIPFAENINRVDPDEEPAYTNAIPIADEVAEELLNPEAVTAESDEPETQDTMEHTMKIGAVQTTAAPEDPDLGHTRVLSPDELQETMVNTIIDDPKPVTKTVTKQTKKEEPKKPVWLYAAVAVAAAFLGIILFFVVNRDETVTPAGDKLALGSTGRFVLAEKFSAYLKDDGTLITAGQSPDVTRLGGTVQIAAKGDDLYGLKQNGTVVTTGSDKTPDAWENITMIAASDTHVLALQKDGKVVCSGESIGCSVSNWEDITEIYAGRDISIAKTKNGKFVTAGVFNSSGAIERLDDAVYFAIADDQIIGVHRDGTADSYPISTAETSILYAWKNVKQAAAGTGFAAGLTSDGQLLLETGNSDLSEAVKDWKGLKYIAAKGGTLTAVSADEKIIGAGSNSYGQCGTVSESPSSQTSAKLASVQNIHFTVSRTNLQISWDAVPNAEYYEITLSTNPETKMKSVRNSASVSATKLTSGETYTVKITPSVQDKTKYADGEPTTVTYTYEAPAEQLAAPQNLQCELKDEVLTITWDAVEHADYYNVAIESMVQKVEGTSLKIEDTKHMEDGREYTVYVTAMSNDTKKWLESDGATAKFTYKAKVVTVKEKLKAPEGLEASVNGDNSWTLKWTKVANAAKYEVVIGSQAARTVETNELTLKADELADGTTYTVTITAIPSDTEKYSNSQKYTTEKVYTVNQPEPTPTPTPEPTPTPTPTPEPTPTPTPTPEPTAEPTPEPTPEQTETPAPEGEGENAEGGEIG